MRKTLLITHSRQNSNQGSCASITPPTFTIPSTPGPLKDFLSTVADQNGVQGGLNHIAYLPTYKLSAPTRYRVEMDSLRKALTIVGLLIFLGISTSQMRAEISEPDTLVSVWYDDSLDSRQLPEMSSNELLKWLTINLVRGQIAKFQEGLMAISRRELGIFISIERIYSTAVEVNVGIIDPLDFKKALTAFEFKLKVVKDLGAGHGKINDYDKDQERWMYANYYYLVADESKLENLLIQGNSENERGVEDRTYVDGYIHLLLAKINNSKDHLVTAVELLESVIEPMVEAEASLRRGRLALHLGRAHLLLSSTRPSPEKEESLTRANFYARLARADLELHLTPLFFGRAHALSADVLSEMVIKKDRNMRNKIGELRRLAQQFE